MAKEWERRICPKTGVLRLEKNVRVTLRETGALAVGKKQDAPPSDVVLRGTSMELGKQARKVVLAGPATATTATQQLSSGQIDRTVG